MFTQRSVPMCVILSIVTCGIYGLYWYVCLTNEVDAVTQEPGPGGGMSLLLSIVTCGIYNIYWGWKMGDKLDAGKKQELEAKVAALKEAMKGENLDGIKAKQEKLFQELKPLGEAILHPCEAPSEEGSE